MFAATNNTERQRYEMVVDNWAAYVTYMQTATSITLIHTLVPTALEGQGVGSTLARSVLDDIRRKRLKIVPECAFIAGFIKRHPEFHDLLADHMQDQPS